MWTVLKVTDRALKRQEFKIDVPTDEDAQIWSEIFNETLLSSSLSSLPLKHHLRITQWEHKVFSHNDIPLLLPSLKRKEDKHVTHILFESVGDEKLPIIVKLTQHVLASWESNDVLGHQVIDSSIKRVSYVLSVSFRTLYQGIDTFEGDFADFSKSSQVEEETDSLQ